jgi:transcriptional regulator GlxA family with amidase domain
VTQVSATETAAMPERGVSARLPDTVNAAIAYMRANASQPLTVSRIASAVGQSARTLQVAFRRDLDQTPMQYLQLVRMTAVRADLLATHRSPGTTVRNLALKWGFTHAARFAAQYRARYGENPSETLRA